MEQLRDRVSDMYTALDDRIEKLTERVLCLEADAVVKTRTCHDGNDGMTDVYVKQIGVLTQDFYQEREERERLVGKADTLQKLLKHAREKYQTLYRDVLAIQNGDDTSAGRHPKERV